MALDKRVEEMAEESEYRLAMESAAAEDKDTKAKDIAELMAKGLSTPPPPPETAAPKEAPFATPRVSGVARGLANRLWNAHPEAESPARNRDIVVLAALDRTDQHLSLDIPGNIRDKRLKCR